MGHARNWNCGSRGRTTACGHPAAFGQSVHGLRPYCKGDYKEYVTPCFPRVILPSCDNQAEILSRVSC